MLAQVIATVNVEAWQLTSVAGGGLALWGLKYMTEVLTYRREKTRDENNFKIKQQAQQQNLDTLKAIQGNLEKLNVETERQSGKLEKVIEVDKVHHDQLLRALDLNCKAGLPLPHSTRAIKTIPPQD